jgi:hypothetical protein
MKKRFSLGLMKLFLAGLAACAIFASGCSFKDGNLPIEDTETALEQKTRITLAVQTSAESK